MKKFVCIVLLVVLSSVVLSYSEVIEEDIGNFNFVSSESDDPHIGEVQVRYKAIYQEKEKVCEASIFVYPSRDLLLATAYDDFDLDQEGVSIYFGNNLPYHIEDVYGWSSGKFFISIAPEFDWPNRRYKEHSCDGLLETYLEKYLNDVIDLKKYKDNNLKGSISTQSVVIEDVGEVSIAPTITNEGRFTHYENADERMEEPVIEKVEVTEEELVEGASIEEPISGSSGTVAAQSKSLSYDTSLVSILSKEPSEDLPATSPDEIEDKTLLKKMWSKFLSFFRLK